MGVIRLADRSITLNLGARVTGFVNGMRTATGAAQDFTARGLDKIEQNSASISTLSNTAGIMGAGMVAAFGAATKAAIDWESNWAGVLKTVDGSTAQLANLEEGLREMARTMPATHAEIAATAEAAGQLGVATDDVLEFTETMVLLGVTTNLSADEAATALARFSNIMGTSTDDVGRMGATIVDLGNNSATTEAEIVTLATRLAAAGRQAGLTEANIFAIASTLTSVGVEAEAGGTAMSKVFTSIGDAVRDGGEKLETFAMVAGVSGTEFQRAFGEDAAGAIGMFVEGMGRLAGEGESTTQIFKDLGLTDQRLMRAILSAGTATGLWAEQVDLANAAWAENTALVDEAEQRFQTTESKMIVAWNNIKDAGIEFGATVLPLIADVAGAVATVAQAFGALPDWVQTASMAIVGGGGLVLLGIAGLGKLALSVSAVSGAMKGLGASAALGGVAKGMGSLARSAGKVAIGIGAVTAAMHGGKAIADWVRGVEDAGLSVELLSSRLGGLSPGMSGFDAILGDLIESGEISARTFGDLASAVDFLSNMSGIDKLVHNLNLSAVGSEEAADAFKMAGEALAGLPLEDAQSRFADLAMEAGGTDQAALALLDTMPTLRDAMIAAAGEVGIAADDTNFLAFVLGKVGPAAEDAAAGAGLLEGAVGEYADAQGEATAATEEWIKMVAEADSAFSSIVGGYQDVIDASMAAAEQQAADTKSTKDSWEDYYDGVSVSMDAWITKLEEQADAQANWQANILQSTADIRKQLPEDIQWAADAMVDEMIAAGVDGAAALATFTEASGEEKERLVNAWLGTGKEIADDFAMDLAAARAPELHINAVPAEEALAAYLGAVANSSEQVTIDGVSVPAENVLAAVRAAILETDEPVQINGDPQPAEDVLDALMTAIHNSEDEVTIDGNRVPANDVVDGLMAWIGRQGASVNVDANTAVAMSRLNALDQTLNRINGKTVTATVAIKQTGQAAVATGGYMGHFAPGFANGGSPRRARGLMIGPGTTTSDSIDARLSTREFVLNAASTAKLGVDGAYRINSGNFDRASVRAAIGLRDGGVPVPRQYQATFQSSQGGGQPGLPLAFPSHVTLVDESGGILAHARVVARDEIGESDRRQRASMS